MARLVWQAPAAVDYEWNILFCKRFFMFDLDMLESKLPEDCVACYKFVCVDWNVVK
jgi:hypothetical protein